MWWPFHWLVVVRGWRTIGHPGLADHL